MEKGLKRLQKGAFEGAAYFDKGTGYPVMLLHGFPADHNLWEQQVSALQTNYRFLLPDLPGTSCSPLVDPINIEQMADFVEEILTQEKIEKCILIGHSMGGYATLAFAEKYPEYLEGWGLFHSSAYADDSEKKKGRKRSIQMMKKYGQGKFLCQMLPNLFSSSFKKKHRPLVQEMIRARTAAGIDALIPYYQAMWERPDRTHVLENTAVPVLFVIGKEDVAAPMEKVLQQVSLPAVSQVTIFENVGHLGMLETPEEATKVLEQFVEFCLRM